MTLKAVYLDRYQGSLCSQADQESTADRHDGKVVIESGTLPWLIRKGLGIDRLFEHQGEIFRKTSGGGAGGTKTTVVSMPPFSGRTTGTLLSTLPNVIGKGGCLLVLGPTPRSASRLAATWEGLARRMRLHWLIDTAVLTGDPEQEDFSRLDAPGTVAFIDLASLHNLLRALPNSFETFLSRVTTVVMEDLEEIPGPIASHTRFVLARLRNRFQLCGTNPQWICLIPDYDDPLRFIELLGLPTDNIDLVHVDSRGRTAKDVQLWVPAAREVRLESEASGPTVRVELERESYWDELIELVVTGLLSGERVAVLAGEIPVSADEWTMIVDEVEHRAPGFQKGGIETRDRLFAGDSLEELRARMLARDLDLDDIDLLLCTGLAGAAAQLERQVRHLGRRRLTVIVLVPRTPYHQYVLNHPSALGFGATGDEGSRGVTAPRAPFATLPAVGPEIPHYHARCMIESGEPTMIGLPSPLEEALTGINREPPLDSANDRAFGTLQVTSDSYVEIVASDTGESLGFMDLHQAITSLYDGGVYNASGRRYRVAAWNKSHGDAKQRVLVEVHGGRPFASRRVSEVEIEPHDRSSASDHTVDRRHFGFGIREATVHETVVGRRTYQFLDFENEQELEEYSTQHLAREFEVSVLQVDLKSPSMEVVHSIAHLLRSALALERGNELERLAVVAQNGSVFIYDEVLLSTAIVSDLNQEGSLLALFERCWEILDDCPCSGIGGCPGCLQDWRCTSRRCDVDKIATLEYLTELLGRDASFIEEKQEVSDDNFREHLKEHVLEVMRTKLLAPIDDPYQLSFWPSVETKEYWSGRLGGAGLLGICIPGKRQIYIDAGLTEAATQDLITHEFFHNYQSEGNLSSALAYYDVGDIQDPRNIPFQGKLFIEGSANWASVIVSDYWGTRERTLQNTRGSGEYLEGYRVMRWLQQEVGVADSLRYLRSGGLPGVPPLLDIFEASGAQGKVDGHTRSLRLNGELRCLDDPHLGRETHMVTASHYVARADPEKAPDDLDWSDLFGMAWPGINALLSWRWSHKIATTTGLVGIKRSDRPDLADLSIEAFLELYGQYGAAEILRIVFAGQYNSKADLPCLQCASAPSERLADACIIHNGLGLLNGFRGVRFRILWAMVRARFGAWQGASGEEDL